MDLKQADIDYFKRGSYENPAFWKRLGGRPDFSGKSVLDVGCGLGSLCVDVALSGARHTVGVDYETKPILFAREYVRRTYPQLDGKIEFHDIELKQFKSEPFDCILSKDAFEHIMDLPGALAEMAERLKPGGKIYAGFGPLYNSPFGHHGRVRSFFPSRKFPWHHLWESEARICRRMNAYRAAGGSIFCYSDAPVTSIRDLGLNMNSLADYRRAIKGSGLKIASFRVNQSDSPLSKVLSVLRRFPFLEEYCTHNVYCVLEKP